MRICIHVEFRSLIPETHLNDFLGLTPVINLGVIFCKVNIFLLLDYLLQEIIYYFTVKGE
jgi:hypothetical protein